MNTRATCWSVTINNPNEGDEEQIAMARQRGWQVEGQKEMGENGTPHYQLMVRTPQVRFSAVKKAFSRAHIEAAKNVAALQKYVTKTETRIGELKETSEMYPSLNKLWELVFNELKNEGFIFCDMCLDRMGYAAAYNLKGAKSDVIMLSMFDLAIDRLIREGYHVETMGVNPQVRTSWVKYGAAICVRVFTSQTDRQTDSQENSVAEEYNHAVSHEEEQEVHVPEAPSTEHASP